MSQVNSINLAEDSSLCETDNLNSNQSNAIATNSDPTVKNKDLNDEFILSLLNNSSDSDCGKDANSRQTCAESVLNNSDCVNDGNISTISNNINCKEVNESKDNFNKVINHMKISEIEIKNSYEEKGLVEIEVEQSKEYRDSDSTWTEDEDSSSSSSSDSDFLFEAMPQTSSVKVNCVKTKGELDIEDLPPIEYLKISVGEEDLQEVGHVHAIVLKLVVIQATKEKKPLDIDSVLFLAPNEPLGRIFEVFGPVVEPFYTVLFNSPEDIIEKGVKVGSEVYFAPLKNEITSYVFIDVLRQQKGSDASWKDNNEPPEEHLDYSDDEQERTARLKRKGKGRVLETVDDDDEVQIIPYKISPNEKRTFNYTSYTRNPSYETQNVTNSSQNHRSNSQTSRNSFHNNSNNLDNVPVWISTPPPYLEPKPLPSHNSINSTTPSFQMKQPASLQIQNQLKPLSNAPQKSLPTQLTGGPILLNPKQPYIPRQPPNLNSQRLAFHSQSPPPPPPSPNGQPLYFSAPQRPPHLMQQNAPRPLLFQNVNRHVFGQITPVGILSPAPSIFSPCPSPAMYVPTNAYPRVPSPAISPNPFWRPQNLNTPSFINVQNPPPSSPLTVQIPTFSNAAPLNVQVPTFSNAAPLNVQVPTFSTPPPVGPITVQIPTFANLPPIVRFSASNNYSVPPPPLQTGNNFSTRSLPHSSRF